MAEISAADLDFLTVAWLRLPAFFRESARYVRPQHFEQSREGNYLVAWMVMSDLYQRYQAVNVEMVLHSAYNLINSGQVTLMEGQADDILTQGENGLITSAFMVDVNNLHLPYCRDTLQRFLHERSVLWPMRRMSQAGGPSLTNESLSSAIEQLSMQHRRIAAVHGLPTRPPAPAFGEARPPASVYHPTGLDWLDRQLRGQREGDCNAFLGFQGAGKSLFAGQLVVASGRVAHTNEGENARWSTLFTYEEPLRKIEPRLQSCAMRIDRTKLDALTDWNTLSTMTNRSHYERQWNSCERDRYEEHRVWFNNTVRAFDMSGSEDFPTNGTGGVSEIVANLDQLQNETGRGIRTVVIDWAMPMVERHMEERKVKEDFLRKELAALGDKLRRQVAERFRCTVWITHQLKSDLSTSPVKLHKHTDAMECKSFCVHMPFCGVLSYPDSTTGVRRFHWSKHRAVGDEQVPPIMLRPGNNIAEFEEVTNRFTVDQITNSIVESRAARNTLGIGA